MQSILVRTIDGIFRCQEQNRTWMVKHKTLDSQEVPCIAVRPDNRNHVYAGTRADGLFKSLDGGGKWEKIGAETLRGKIRSLAIDPVEPATMYIGTEPAGLLISDDEGRTWREAPACAKSLKIANGRIRCRLSNRMFAGSLLPRRQREFSSRRKLAGLFTVTTPAQAGEI
jgi:hypothetical protein